MNKKKFSVSISADAVLALTFIAAFVVISLTLEADSIRLAVFSVIFAAALTCFLFTGHRRQIAMDIAARVIADRAEPINQYINAGSIPTVLTRANGRIIWYSPAFFPLAGVRRGGKNIFKIFPELKMPAKDKKISINGRDYVRDTIPASIDGMDYTLYRFIAPGEATEITDLNNLVMSTLCYLQIDNYEDLRQSLDQNRHAELNAQITGIIARHAKKLKAAYLRYDRDKYAYAFERRYISALAQDKFSILEEIRSIDTGVPALYPTLSIGIGAGKTPEASSQNALRALETALGRGGDQAVLKNDDGFKFYGGIQQGQEKRTRVKARMFTVAFKNLMEQCSSIMIMGHTVPDLDCMGAALGIAACARAINKNARIVIDQANPSIKALTDELRRDPDYAGMVISPSDALALLDQKTLVVVVDTLTKDHVQSLQLLREASITVVIDHHVRGADYIENPTLLLHEPYASSAAEMVTEIIQYFADSIAIKPIEAEALLSGIMLDTKAFSFKTGVRTFEAASFLRRMGADTTRIRQLFQDDRQTFMDRANVVKSAHITDSGIAIAICPDHLDHPQLLAAQAADALVGIQGILSSFVLCDVNNVIIISGRSLGAVNVQRILEKLGGGGHATIAGAQIRGKSMDGVVRSLEAAIREYESEV
jgi:c-di-AMP phosphodiesterase-like protein